MPIATGTALLLGSGIAAGSNALTAALSAKQAEKLNKKQLEQTEKWNQINLDYAKNAQTYAAADRMRAGLSPLDSVPQSAPAVQTANLQQADFSGVGAAGSSISSGIQAALNYKLNEQSVQAQADLNNALKSKAESETFAQDTGTMKVINEMMTDLAIKKAELENISNKNSTYYKEVETQLREAESRIRDLESQINQRDTLTPSLQALNESNVGRNNAESSALQNDLTFSNAFGIPYSMVRSLNFNGPFAATASDSFLAALKAKEAAQAKAEDAAKKSDFKDSSSVRQAYDEYVKSYDKAMNELEKDYNAYFASGKTDKRIEQDFKDRKRAIGKKLSYKAFVKIAYGK